MNEAISCSLPDAVRQGRQRDIRQMLLAVVEEVVELEDGYALRFPGESRWVRVAAELWRSSGSAADSLHSRSWPSRRTGPCG